MQWRKANAICRQEENAWTLDDEDMMRQGMKAAISTRMEAGCSAPTRLCCSSRQEENKLCLCPAAPWGKLAPEQNQWARACLAWMCQGAGYVSGMQVHSSTGWSGCEARSQTVCQKLCRLPPLSYGPPCGQGALEIPIPPTWLCPSETCWELGMFTTASVPDRQLELLHEGDQGMEKWPLQMITISCCHCCCLFWLW